MTNRQKRILDLVRPYLSDVYRQAARETADKPAGWEVLIRVPRPFVPFSSALKMLSVHVLKDREGFKFRVDEPLFWQRKGHTAPKWRTLNPPSEAGA